MARRGKGRNPAGHQPTVPEPGSTVRPLSTGRSGCGRTIRQATTRTRTLVAHELDRRTSVDPTDHPAGPVRRHCQPDREGDRPDRFQARPRPLHVPRRLRLGSDRAGTPVFEIVEPEKFYRRLGRDLKMAFGEAYVAGELATRSSRFGNPETLFQRIRELPKHLAIYGAGDVAIQALNFLLLPLYVRYLTPADYGVLRSSRAWRRRSSCSSAGAWTARSCGSGTTATTRPERQRLASTLFLFLLGTNGVLLALSWWRRHSCLTGCFNRRATRWLCSSCCSTRSPSGSRSFRFTFCVCRDARANSAR